MSRTYRRKHDHASHNWKDFESEKEFDHIKEIWEAGNPKPTEPTTKFVETQWYHYHNDRKDLNVEWTVWRNSDEYRDWRTACSFLKKAHGKLTFAEYNKARIAKAHADGTYGSGWLHSVPSAFTNLYSQRPARQKDRMAIRQGLVHDNWDELDFYQFRHSISWDYW